MLIEATQDITVEAWDKVYGKPGYEDSRIVLGLFRHWAEEFEKWWQSDDVAQEEDDYMSAIDKFTERKVSELIRELGCGEKYIVRITRIEKYEGDVLVTAASQREAEEKVADAWQDEEYQWLYEDMTDCVNCDSQTYKATPATDGAHWDFDLTNYKLRG